MLLRGRGLEVETFVMSPDKKKVNLNEKYDNMIERNGEFKRQKGINLMIYLCLKYLIDSEKCVHVFSV